MLGKSKKRKPNRVDSLIGQQSHVLGDIRFGGGLHIDGTIKGNVSADGDERATLTVSDRGTIEGEVRVPYIILNGLVKGDVYANEHVELASSARVEGNVYYALIEMAMGAEVNGKLVRITDDQRPPLALDHHSDQAD
ncbi:MAG: polymer-forming cytoskeletal protein [Gammaproteobacteria bacterium]